MEERITDMGQYWIPHSAFNSERERERAREGGWGGGDAAVTVCGPAGVPQQGTGLSHGHGQRASLFWRTHRGQLLIVAVSGEETPYAPKLGN